MLGQIFRRDFPNYSAGFSFSIPLRNRQAQADYAMDQLTIRQKELQLQRSVNQIRVEVRNAVIGLQQARARYDTAVATRVLAEQSLKAEQDKFKYGATGTDVTTVIQAQKDLVNDQTLEAQAMANYTHAKISFDQSVGRTLSINNVQMDEAMSGHVARESILPATLPAPATANHTGDEEMNRRNFSVRSWHAPARQDALSAQGPVIDKPSGSISLAILQASVFASCTHDEYRAHPQPDAWRKAVSYASGRHRAGDGERP